MITRGQAVEALTWEGVRCGAPNREEVGGKEKEITGR